MRSTSREKNEAPSGSASSLTSQAGSCTSQALGPLPFAERLRAETGLPTVAVGLITEPEQAEAVIAEGRADLVALARAMLFNPHWPWHAAARLGGQVQAPPQYWRSQPRGRAGLFGDVRIGQR